MSEHEQIEGLHQRAAENYLQGQFQEALNSWRELLTLDSQDERAIEGIRLCELIVQQTSDGDVSERPPWEEDPPSVMSPDEGSDVDFDEIARLLEEPDEPDAKAATADDPGWDFSAFEDTPPATDGLDLADLPALGSEPSPESDGDDFAIPALDLADPLAAGEAGDVQAQIADLLSQASTSYDAGDLEGALTLLDRVFALDPDNVPAAALAKAFREDIDTRDEPLAGEGPTPDAVADENLQSLGLAAPPGKGDLTEKPLVPTPPLLAMADDALSALDEPDAETDGACATGPSAKVARPVVSKPLLIGIGVVAALAAAGFLGFRLTGSDSAVRGAGNEAPAGILRPADGAPTPGAAQQAGSEPQAQQTPQATQDGAAVSGAADVRVQDAPVEDLATVMTRARAAFDAGEFSKAVVAFNEALQIAPDDPVARRGLSQAGAAYQEQREFVTKLDSATESFVRGDYRAALRVFYRLPGTDGVPRFDRFKANSWYNLGVAALKTGSCGDAKSHLAEAGALLPDDRAVAVAARFAATCATSQGDLRWYDDVQRLTERRLED